MIDVNLIQMLRCPLDGSELVIAEESLVRRVNEAIQQGNVRDRLDQKVTQTLDQGLLSTVARRLYAVRGGIPVLIGDEAIELSQLPDC